MAFGNILIKMEETTYS